MQKDYRTFEHGVDKNEGLHAVAGETSLLVNWISIKARVVWLLRGQCQRCEGVHDEIEPQKLHGCERLLAGAGRKRPNHNVIIQLKGEKK